MTKLLPAVCMDCGHRFATTASRLLNDGACQKCASDDLDYDAGGPPSVQREALRTVGARRTARVAEVARSIRQDNPSVTMGESMSLAREAVHRYQGVVQ